MADQHSPDTLEVMLSELADFTPRPIPLIEVEGEQSGSGIET